MHYLNSIPDIWKERFILKVSPWPLYYRYMLICIKNSTKISDRWKRKVVGVCSLCQAPFHVFNPGYPSRGCKTSCSILTILSIGRYLTANFSNLFASILSPSALYAIAVL